MYLEETHKLSEYNLKYDAVLELSSKIKVQLLKEEIGTKIIHIARTKKIKDLKELIVRDYKVPMEKLLLKLGSDILDDELVLDDLVYVGDEIIHQIVDPNLDCRTECIAEGYDYCVDFTKPGSKGKCCSDEECKTNLTCSNTQNKGIPI